MKGKVGELCNFQDCVIIILEGSRLDKSSIWVGDKHPAVMIIARIHNGVLLLHLTPCQQVVEYVWQKGNAPAGIHRLGGTV